MAKNPDQVRFSGGFADGRMLTWDGPWPPPEKLTLAYGRLSGIIQSVDVEKLTPEIRADIEAARTVDLAEYHLVSASALPDDFESEHVFRGADYRVADPSNGGETSIPESVR